MRAPSGYAHASACVCWPTQSLIRRIGPDVLRKSNQATLPQPLTSAYRRREKGVKK